MFFLAFFSKKKVVDTFFKKTDKFLTISQKTAIKKNAETEKNRRKKT
jgi:hypothetical protein